MQRYFCIVDTPIGELLLIASHNHLLQIEFDSNKEYPRRSNAILSLAVEQLGEYFIGERSHFTIPYRYVGTPFQVKCWNYLMTIPYGETRSYLQEATAISSPRAVRAVAQANKRNPLPILTPCHRVIAHSGELSGYGGGVWRKEWLLTHERVLNRSSEASPQRPS
ncbi:MAG: methylated-DNA--[protein]-cysteine S-methyltransferase [Candidatus Dojkabacteria bacterium]|nr:MAG: methylated-DNA--[protein]-cysteine S-methyltransferase [Candidatus Dojkabacteria bacterium]